MLMTSQAQCTPNPVHTSLSEQKCGNGNMAWEIDLSEFKSSKNKGKQKSRVPRPPCRQTVEPLPASKQLSKEVLPVVEVATSTMVSRPEDMSTRKVLDLQRWYVQGLLWLHLSIV